MKLPYGIDPNKPFEHVGGSGTILKAKRCDLVGGYDLYRPFGISDERFASDVAEIFCWFWANIVPELNGFNLSRCNKIHKGLASGEWVD